MTAQERRIIDPTTRIAEQNTPSRSRLARRRMVSVGQTPDGGQYVQIGSTLQVSLFVQVEEEMDNNGKPSSAEIFRLEYDHEPHGFLKDGGIQDRGIEQLKTAIVDGGDLVEGVFTTISRPGQPSTPVENATGVWAPLKNAFGDNWELK